MRYRSARIKNFASQVLVLIGHFCYTKGVPVLLYHSIDKSESVISIAPEQFSEQMGHLRSSGYRTISLPQLVNYLQVDGKPPSRTVVITFDDGFENNYTEAFPILRSHGFTATIFLATDYIGGVCTWDRHESIPEIPLLSWHEIQEMSDYGIDFGAHGCSHSYLTRLSEAKMKDEIRESKSKIEAKTGKRVSFFCHPYGYTNWITQQAVQECGYLGAFGGVDFSLANSKDNLYDLKRLGTAHFSSIWDFRAGLLGTYDWYIKIKECLGIEGLGD